MARIFLIEDDEGVRTQLTALLRNAGNDVLCAMCFDRLSDDVLPSVSRMQSAR